MAETIFKDVVVIGNGPSAITLSYMLAGNWPYYNDVPHPIDFLQNRLEENRGYSLLEQDLSYLSEGLEGRSLNPVSVLFDTLNHPQADLGIENPSVISWRYQPNKLVNHVVLGKGVPGGSWQKMDGSTLTISLGSWMELPNLNIREWDAARCRSSNGVSGLRQKRATVGTIADYYRFYVYSKDLSNFFVNNATVTSISQFNSLTTENLPFDHLWKINGYTENYDIDSDQINRKSFSYISPNVVLATGNSDQPNKLNVEGEDLPIVLYSLSDLEELIEKQILSPKTGSILIVGAGLSAADAVIAARFHSIPIIHVFRRSVCDPEVIFNKLPQNIYPEYHKVHKMMQDSNSGHYDGYKAYPCSKVTAIKSDGTVIITSCKDDSLVSVVTVSHVVVLIGMHPDLSFLPYRNMKIGINPQKPVDCKKNPIDINLFNHKTVFYPGIYAVGPLVGDNFVRFVQGGCFAVASHIVKSGDHKTA